MVRSNALLTVAPDAPKQAKPPHDKSPTAASTNPRRTLAASSPLSSPRIASGAPPAANAAANSTGISRQVRSRQRGYAHQLIWPCTCQLCLPVCILDLEL
jgi:hypothetical protein